jgi:ParB family chromosome partitioning protein
MASSVKKQVSPLKQGQSLPVAPVAAKPKKSASSNRQPEEHPESKPPAEILRDVFRGIGEGGSTPKRILRAIPDNERHDAEAWLRGFYEAGRRSKVVGDVGQSIVRNLRTGQFATEGEGAFALLAFLKGSTGEGEFNVLKILGDCHAIAKAPD